MRRRRSPPSDFTQSQHRLEHQWLVGLRAGHMQAFDALYVAYIPALYAFAQRFVSADLAEDIVQDVMVDLWDRRAMLVVHGSLRGYLFGAVRRRIADRHRHEGMAERVLATMGPDTPLLTGLHVLSPDQAAEADDLQTAINVALSTLPARSRLIITLRWIDGLTYPEIAEALGISVDAAKKQGRRIEQLLRTLLARFAPP